MSTHQTESAAATFVGSKVPEVTVLFWTIKLLSTGMGEATSDFLTHLLPPLLAVAIGFAFFAVSLVIQFRTGTYRAWPYWFAVVMVSVFGTMAADIAHVGLDVSYEASTAFFAVALAVILIIWRRVEGTLSIHSIVTRRRETFYWLTVLTTFALGTAAGDWTAHTLNWGFLVSAFIFTLVLLIPALGFRLLRWNAIFAFWFAYIVTRPVGASFADWIGADTDRGGLGFGFGNISLVLTAGIIVLVFCEFRRLGDSQKGAARRGEQRLS